MLVELSVLDLLAAAAAALVLLWVLARPRRGLFLWSLALLPILVVYIANPENRIFSYHGFLHLSIVNLILMALLAGLYEKMPESWQTLIGW